jgi:hypothetical protein
MKIISRILAVLCTIALGFTLAGSITTANATPATKAAVAPDPRPALMITAYGSNAPGADRNKGQSGDNRNREFVRLSNTTGADLDVTGYRVHDAYRNGDGVYSNGYTMKVSDLPAVSLFRVDAGPVGVDNDDRFVMPAGSLIYLYNGDGADGNPGNLSAAIYRDFKHVWNNGGDDLYVRNAAGAVLHKVTYSPYRVDIR